GLRRSCYFSNQATFYPAKGVTVAKRIDLFDSTYSHFTKQVLETIRKETFGQDIGQNSWTTLEEYDRFISWLDLRPDHHVLEVASGSGGPARYLASSVSCPVSTRRRQAARPPIKAWRAPVRPIG